MAGSSSRQMLASSVTEADLQAQVMRMLDLFGWLGYHTWSSKHSEPGFPDVVALKGPRLLVAELKREGKNPTAEQWAWLDAFHEAGAETYVWRPSNLGEIEQVLAVVSPRGGVSAGCGQYHGDGRCPVPWPGCDCAGEYEEPSAR